MHFSYFLQVSVWGIAIKLVARYAVFFYLVFIEMYQNVKVDT